MYERRTPRQHVLEMALGVVIGVLIILGVAVSFGRTWPWNLSGLAMIVFSLFMVPTALTWRLKRYVHRALREQGYDLCRECGYWLRGLHKGVKKCPECGADRDSLAASHTEPQS